MSMTKDQEFYYTKGLLYAIQQLVCFADEPDLAADYLIKESGIPVAEFIAAQKDSGHNNRKMKKFFEENFSDPEPEEGSAIDVMEKTINRGE